MTNDGRSDVAFSQQVIHSGVCQKVHVKNRQIRVKIDQNGVKIGSKSDQKRAHFVMPILTFWGVTPSGASAKAVLGYRKGFFGGYFGPKRACGKVIHKMCKTGIRAYPLGVLPSSTSPPDCQATTRFRGRIIGQPQHAVGWACCRPWRSACPQPARSPSRVFERGGLWACHRPWAE